MKANTLQHFAINADDTARARAFYQQVFGWRFEPWGPPDFFHIKTENGERPGLIGALQNRRELIAGQKTVGLECTVAVENVDKVKKAVVAGGGRVVMDKTIIAGVGELIFFEDPEGNVMGAMRFDTDAE